MSVNAADGTDVELTACCSGAREELRIIRVFTPVSTTPERVVRFITSRYGSEYSLNIVTMSLSLVFSEWFVQGMNQQIWFNRSGSLSWTGKWTNRYTNTNRQHRWRCVCTSILWSTTFYDHVCYQKSWCEEGVRRKHESMWDSLQVGFTSTVNPICHVTGELQCILMGMYQQP